MTSRQIEAKFSFPQPKAERSWNLTFSDALQMLQTQQEQFALMGKRFGAAVDRFHQKVADFFAPGFERVITETNEVWINFLGPQDENGKREIKHVSRNDVAAVFGVRTLATATINSAVENQYYNEQMAIFSQMRVLDAIKDKMRLVNARIQVVQKKFGHIEFHIPGLVKPIPLSSMQRVILIGASLATAAAGAVAVLGAGRPNGNSPIQPLSPSGPTDHDKNPLPTLAPQPTAFPTPTVVKPTAVFSNSTRPEVVCGSELENAPKVIFLTDHNVPLPEGMTATPQRFTNTTPLGRKIAAALNREASLDPAISDPNNLIACSATHDGDISPAIVVVNRQTGKYEVRVFDPATKRFIPSHDQRVTGSNLPLGLDKTIAAPLSVELARTNGQTVGGFDLLTYVNPETGALLAILDFKTQQFVHGQDLVDYKKELSHLPYVGDLPDTFPQQLQAMYKNTPWEKIISYWKFVRFPAQGDGWQPVAVTTDGKEIKPMSDKLWQAIQRKMAEAAKLQINGNGNGNGEGQTVVNFVWNNNPASPKYVVYAESGSNGEKTIAFFSPENQKPLEVKVPKDAKNFSWNFEHQQATYQSQNNTTFYYDESSAQWYNVAGFHPKPINAENAADVLKNWKTPIVNTSAIKYLTDNATDIKNVASFDPKNPMRFIGGTQHPTEVFIRNAISTELPILLAQLPNDLSLRKAASALLAMKIEASDSATPILAADGISVLPPMRFNYNHSLNLLQVHPQSLRIAACTLGVGECYRETTNISPLVLQNLLAMALAAYETTKLDLPNVSCPISATDVTYPQALIDLSETQRALLQRRNLTGAETSMIAKNVEIAKAILPQRRTISASCIK